MGTQAVNRFTLTIEDDRQAVWMAINDSFTSERGQAPVDRASHGILIQLGTAERQGDSMVMTEVKSVDFYDDGTPFHSIARMSLEDPKETWWINIRQDKNPDKPRKLMKPEHLKALRVDPSDKRSLHKYFNPYLGGITMWPDGPLNIRMEPARKEDFHVEYTFTLEGNVSVEVYKNGALVPLSKSPTHIRIVKDILRPPPGETTNPPQYP